MSLNNEHKESWNRVVNAMSLSDATYTSARDITLRSLPRQFPLKPTTHNNILLNRLWGAKIDRNIEARIATIETIQTFFEQTGILEYGGLKADHDWSGELTDLKNDAISVKRFHATLNEAESKLNAQSPKFTLVPATRRNRNRSKSHGFSPQDVRSQSSSSFSPQDARSQGSSKPRRDRSSSFSPQDVRSQGSSSFSLQDVRSQGAPRRDRSVSDSMNWRKYQ